MFFLLNLNLYSKNLTSKNYFLSKYKYKLKKIKYNLKIKIKILINNIVSLIWYNNYYYNNYYYTYISTHMFIGHYYMTIKIKSIKK